MTAAPEHRGPLERVFDVTFYAPLGFALSVAEAIPGLARKGRSRLEPQLGLARTVGQFAVHQGLRRAREAAGGAGPLGGFPFRSAPARPAAPATSARSGPASASGSSFAGPAPRPAPAGPSSTFAGPAPAPEATGPAGTAAAAQRPGPSSGPGVPPGTGRASPTGPAADGPSPHRLAIPGYDSLSAPQVVQRLAGLSREEIQAVRAYEAATRGRRTIIARADQLLA
jgi:hypothetical protein